MPSKKTKVVGVRLSNEMVAKIESRVKRGGSAQSVSDYIRSRLEYDINRRHSKKKK